MVSTDGLYSFEARAFLKRLVKLLAEEWVKPYSIVKGLINARISIILVREKIYSSEVPGFIEVICRINFVGKEEQVLDF